MTHHLIEEKLSRMTPAMLDVCALTISWLPDHPDVLTLPDENVKGVYDHSARGELDRFIDWQCNRHQGMDRSQVLEAMICAMEVYSLNEINNYKHH